MSGFAWKWCGYAGVAAVAAIPLVTAGCQPSGAVRQGAVDTSSQAGVTAAQVALADRERAVPSDKPIAANGEVVWQARCASCHGLDGKGKGTLPDFTDFKYTRDKTPLSTYVTISGGTAPHPFGSIANQTDFLTDQQRWDVTYYVWEMHTTFDELKKGGATFVVNCSVCHGTKGRGDGQLHFSLNPQPRNFTVFDWMMDKPDNRLFRSIQHGRKWTAMPAWGQSPVGKKPLVTEQDTYQIIDFLRTYTYQYPKDIIVERPTD